MTWQNNKQFWFMLSCTHKLTNMCAMGVCCELNTNRNVWIVGNISMLSVVAQKRLYTHATNPKSFVFYLKIIYFCVYTLANKHTHEYQITHSHMHSLPASNDHNLTLRINIERVIGNNTRNTEMKLDDMACSSNASEEGMEALKMYSH